MTLTSVPQSNGMGAPRPESPFVVIGTARLPAGALGEKPGPLMIELSLDESGGRIVDVATNIPLPGYNGLLRRLLMGGCMREVESIAQRLCDHCQGPLLKPSAAALANAVAHTRR